MIYHIPCVGWGLSRVKRAPGPCSAEESLQSYPAGPQKSRGRLVHAMGKGKRVERESARKMSLRRQMETHAGALARPVDSLLQWRDPFAERQQSRRLAGDHNPG